MKTKARAVPTYLESIRLSESDYTALARHRPVAPGSAGERRRAPRAAPGVNFSLLAEMQHPGGSVSYFRIQPCDISTSGLGFFHRAFVYPGTRCTFTARTVHADVITLRGRVVRCRHIRGHIHDVGVRFEREAPLDELATVIPPEQAGAGLDEDWNAEMSRMNVDLRALLRRSPDPEAVRRQLLLMLQAVTPVP